jgi:N-acetylmuramoyl-L-alanine amidase
MPEYTVQQGDTIQSIAARNKLGWDKVWQHSRNTQLRNQRKEPGLLLPGDNVFVPERETKQVDCATGQCHRFKVNGSRTLLHLRLMDEENQPMANTSYQLEVDGRLLEGSTDADGHLEQSVPALARSARLKIPAKDLVYPIHLGCLDPAEEIQGLQGRLRNLGYYQGRIDNHLGPKTAAALRKFQKDHELEQTGKADAATKKKLEELHAY